MNSVDVRREMADDAYFEDDFRLAFRLYRRLAMEGDAHSMSRFGELHLFGFGIPANRAVAMRWFRAAAERNAPEGLYQLGCSYIECEASAVDMPAAVACFRRAAQMGHVHSQYEMGVRYERGEGVPRDLKRAMHWYRLGALQYSDEARARLYELLCDQLIGNE